MSLLQTLGAQYQFQEHPEVIANEKEVDSKDNVTIQILNMFHHL